MFNNTISIKFFAPRRQGAKKESFLVFSELGALCGSTMLTTLSQSKGVYALALWSISPGRDNPTRSSCYFMGRVVFSRIPRSKIQRKISKMFG